MGGASGPRSATARDQHA